MYDELLQGKRNPLLDKIMHRTLYHERDLFQYFNQDNPYANPEEFKKHFVRQYDDPYWQKWRDKKMADSLKDN